MYHIYLKPLTWVLILLDHCFGEATISKIPECPITCIEPSEAMQQTGYWAPYHAHQLTSMVLDFSRSYTLGSEIRVLIISEFFFFFDKFDYLQVLSIHIQEEYIFGLETSRALYNLIWQRWYRYSLNSLKVKCDDNEYITKYGFNNFINLLQAGYSLSIPLPNV